MKRIFLYILLIFPAFCFGQDVQSKRCPTGSSQVSKLEQTSTSSSTLVMGSGGSTIKSGRNCGDYLDFWKTQTDYVLFVAKIANISNNKLYNTIVGSSDYLVISTTQGDYTFTPPNTETYKTADLDSLFFNKNNTQHQASTVELVSYDFRRTIVKYADASPYNIESIMILKNDLPDILENKMRDDFHLSVWWNDTLSSYGYLKGNRAVGKSYYYNYTDIIQDGNSMAWYDATNSSTVIRSAEDIVSNWEDVLGTAARDLSVVGGEPAWSSGGILFDGDNDYLQRTFTNNQPIMVYIVVKPITWTINDRIFDGSTSGCYVQQTTGSPYIRAYAGTSSSNTALTVGNYSIIRASFNGASGVLQVNENTAITGNFGTNNMGGFTVAASSFEGNNGNMQIQEIILRKVIDGAVNSGKLYNYLKIKYQL